MNLKYMWGNWLAGTVVGFSLMTMQSTKGLAELVKAYPYVVTVLAIVAIWLQRLGGAEEDKRKK